MSKLKQAQEPQTNWPTMREAAIEKFPEQAAMISELANDALMAFCQENNVVVTGGKKSPTEKLSAAKTGDDDLNPMTGKRVKVMVAEGDGDTERGDFFFGINGVQIKGPRNKAIIMDRAFFEAMKAHRSLRNQPVINSEGARTGDMTAVEVPTFNLTLIE